MKIFLVLPFFILSLYASGQYDPSKATVTNKPLGIAQAVPTDARSYYYSPSLFIWRPYQSTAEVLATLNITKYRIGHFPIYVNIGGALQSNGSFVGGTIKEYWFKDGTADGDLVEKVSGGGGGSVDNNSGTVAQLRQLSTTTGKAYFSTDLGGEEWTDIGIFDGQYADDGVTYIITANNHVLRGTTYYTKKEVDIKKYGLPCDGVFHTISSLLPSVTLSQVHAFDATANLSSSADWYIISMLLKTLPVQSSIIISGAAVIDREIVIKRGAFEIRGINSPVADKFANNKSKIIQVGNGKDVFKVIDGDGTTYGYGVGQVNNVLFKNLIIEGTMTSTNLSGDGFSFHLSPDAVSGTAINWHFEDVIVRGCSNGFKHYNGHMNNFFFDRCEFSTNFNAGFVVTGDSHNQFNYVNFTNTSFDANGYKFVGSSLVDYVQDTAAPNLTKGGFICTQIVALTMSGVSLQVNHGYGIDLGPGAHLGVSINGYAEANQLGDLRIMNDSSYNINVIAAGLYSRDRTYIIPDPEVRKRALVLLGNEWSTKGLDVINVPSGNVGIGTTLRKPLSKLDVATLADTTYISAGYGSTTHRTKFGWNNVAGRGEVLTDSSIYPFEISPGGIRKFQVNSTGVTIGQNLNSVGTLPPTNGLLVEGKIVASPAVADNQVVTLSQLNAAVIGSGSGSVAGTTLAGLRASNTTTNNVYIISDYGGGTFIDKGLNDGNHTDNTAIDIISANGHWLQRQYNGRIKAEWFGVVADDGINDAPALNAALFYAKRRKQRDQIELPSGTLDISSNINIDSSFGYLIGQGRDNTILSLTGTARIRIKAVGSSEYVYRSGLENLSINANSITPYCIETYLASELAIQNVAVSGATVANFYSDISDIIHLDQYLSSNTVSHMLLKNCGHITASHTNFWNADNVILLSGTNAVVNMEINADWFENFSTFLKFGDVGNTEATIGTMIVNGRFLSTRSNATILDIRPGVAVASENLVINGSIGLPITTRGIFSFENKTNTNSFFRIRTSANITSCPNSPGIFKRSDSSYTGNLWIHSDYLINSAFIPMFAGGAFDISGSYGANNLNYIPSGVILSADYNNGRLFYQNGRLNTSVSGVTRPIPFFEDTVTMSNRVLQAKALAERWTTENTSDLSTSGSIGLGASVVSTAKMNVDVTTKQYGIRAFSSGAWDPTITLSDASNSYSWYLNHSTHAFGLYDWNRASLRLSMDTTGKFSFSQPTKGMAATADDEFTIRSQMIAALTDSLNARYASSSFTLRNAHGTGDTLMKVISGSEVAIKRIVINGYQSKVVNDTTITYNLGATGVNGTVSFVGDGSTTSFTIPFNVAGVSSSSKVFLTAKTSIGAAIDWVDVSTESITVYYLTAPSSGTKTLNYYVIP